MVEFISRFKTDEKGPMKGVLLQEEERVQITILSIEARIHSPTVPVELIVVYDEGSKGLLDVNHIEAKDGIITLFDARERKIVIEPDCGDELAYERLATACNLFTYCPANLARRIKEKGETNDE